MSPYVNIISAKTITVISLTFKISHTRVSLQWTVTGHNHHRSIRLYDQILQGGTVDMSNKDIPESHTQPILASKLDSHHPNMFSTTIATLILQAFIIYIITCILVSNVIGHFSPLLVPFFGPSLFPLLAKPFPRLYLDSAFSLIFCCCQFQDLFAYHQQSLLGLQIEFCVVFYDPQEFPLLEGREQLKFLQIYNTCKEQCISSGKVFTKASNGQNQRLEDVHQTQGSLVLSHQWYLL